MPTRPSPPAASTAAAAAADRPVGLNLGDSSLKVGLTSRAEPRATHTRTLVRLMSWPTRKPVRSSVRFMKLGTGAERAKKYNECLTPGCLEFRRGTAKVTFVSQDCRVSSRQQARSVYPLRPWKRLNSARHRT
jgi:hypothetical protein